MVQPWFVISETLNDTSFVHGNGTQYAYFLSMNNYMNRQLLQKPTDMVINVYGECVFRGFRTKLICQHNDLEILRCPINPLPPSDAVWKEIKIF